VARLAERILSRDYPSKYNDYYRAVTAIAYFHDANDRKYEDKQGSLTKKTKSILRELYEKYDITLYRKDDTTIDNADEFVEMALLIISYISFTKEDNAMQKNNPIRYEAELGRNNAIIRHIVSDADKIDSLGMIGIFRCETYTKETWTSQGKSYTQKEVNREIKRLFDTRFNRLIDEFMRTSHGKELAKPLLEEMREGLDGRGIL
jgi:HD superfamily phosphodiesterase